VARKRKKPILIIALDVESRHEALELVDSLRGRITYFKIGSRLFTAEGTGIVREIHEAGASVFLDLKFHDIPATVAGSIRAATRLGVWMMTLHTMGGVEMMKAAVEAAVDTANRDGRERPLLVGVTILTSLTGDDLSAFTRFDGDVSDLVVRLAGRAREAGLDGVVASVEETSRIKREVGQDVIVVTPGIRLAGESAGDQKRVATPRDAARSGSDYIVVGRPVIKAPSPVAAVDAILEELD